MSQLRAEEQAGAALPHATAARWGALHTTMLGGRKMKLWLEPLATKEHNVEQGVNRERHHGHDKCGAGLAPLTTTMWCMFRIEARGRGGKQEPANISERGTSISTT
jgi:hypothetical protein